jgi:hypothetical protein
MIFVSEVHKLYGPSLVGFATLTRAMEAWGHAKGDPLTLEAHMTNDRGVTVLFFNRGLNALD